MGIADSRGTGLSEREEEGKWYSGQEARSRLLLSIQK